MTNLILATDSYKFTHHKMYPQGTEYVYSYFESRIGAAYNKTVFFGLQYYLKKYLEGCVVTQEHIDEAEALVSAHIGPNVFNREMWQRIVDVHKGHLPLQICAVEEGSVVDVNNVLMTVVNNDPRCAALTNAFETLLTQIWYPCTVATRSASLREVLQNKFDKSSDNPEALNFTVHDFGFRGVSSMESAGLGGAAHLINFMGTSTVAGMLLARDYYDAKLNSLAFSVPASEHSVMCSSGRSGEKETVERILNEYPTGIVSIVADTYNIEDFLEKLICQEFKEKILQRQGKVVIRPDSPRWEGDTPDVQVLWILDVLWNAFGGTINSKGYKVLHPNIGVLYGDGLSVEQIQDIFDLALEAGYSAENIVVGQGGGLLQKLNRDTQRFAFKASAIRVNGIWRKVSKNPMDSSKKSKEGFLELVKGVNGYKTISHDRTVLTPFNQLRTVFLNGHILRESTFDEIRKRSREC